MPRSLHRLPFKPLGLLLIAAATLGCSSGDRPDIGEVRGVITLDGEPMPDAMIQFKAPGFRLSQAFTKPDGSYEMIYLRDIKGVAVGTHQVYIDRVTQHESTPKHLRLPARYNDETTLTAKVKPGVNKVDFPLTSDK